MKKAIYVSVWDESVYLESVCLVKETTREIFILESHDANVDILESEYVIIDNVRFPVCNIAEYDGNGYFYQ